MSSIQRYSKIDVPIPLIHATTESNPLSTTSIGSRSLSSNIKYKMKVYFYCFIFYSNRSYSVLEHLLTYKLIIYRLFRTPITNNHVSIFSFFLFFSQNITQ